MIKEFFREYFGTAFDEKKVGVLEGIKIEGLMYFKEGKVGGYSSCYCKMAWDKKRLKCDADLSVFDLLLEIDVKNGADTTKILNNLCKGGAFGAAKVRANLKIEIPFLFRESTSPKLISSGLTKLEEVSLKV